MTTDMNALANRVAVVGVGTTRYGRQLGSNAYELGWQAFREALDDCGLRVRDIDGLIVNRLPDYRHFAELCGMNPRYMLATPGHGRFSGICMQTAVAIVASGIARTVALVYANTGGSDGERYGGRQPALLGYGSSEQHWSPYGMTSPGAYHALMMQSHMHRYGTNTDQLGKVAMTFREHAALNPNAVMRTPFDLSEYRASRWICEPLRLLDYCIVNDGAVALIVTSTERAKDLAKPPVLIKGVAQASQFSDSSYPPNDFWREPMAIVSRAVHEMAGIERDGVDGLMIYDNFTPNVLFSLEGFGYCAPGESGAWVEDGNLALRGGRYPANTSGGHLSESYMQGWGLNVEAVRQLRGECGDRQIEGARVIQYMAAAPVITSIIYGNE